MHTHISALSAAQTFLMVLIAGTFWRLGAAYLAVDPHGNPRPGLIGDIGQMASWQY